MASKFCRKPFFARSGSDYGQTGELAANLAQICKLVGFPRSTNPQRHSVQKADPSGGVGNLIDANKVPTLKDSPRVVALVAAATTSPRPCRASLPSRSEPAGSSFQHPSVQNVPAAGSFLLTLRSNLEILHCWLRALCGRNTHLEDISTELSLTVCLGNFV